MKIDIADGAFFGMAKKAEGAAQLLAALAHPKRLLALGHLQRGEMSVGQLAALVGLAPRALSQHLARLRDLGVVAPRRQGQVVFYRLARAEVAPILRTIGRLYGAAASGCGDPAPSRASSASLL